MKTMQTMRTMQAMRFTLILASILVLVGCQKKTHQVEMQTPAYDETATDTTTIHATPQDSAPPRLDAIRPEQPPLAGEDATPVDAHKTVPLGNDGTSNERRISDYTQPTPETTSTVTPPGTRPYTVAKGDNYWNIATRLLGDGQRWREIRELNPSVDPTKLRIGQVIVVPEK